MTTARPTRDDLLRCIERMAGTPVLVAADLVLDEFEYGTIERVSREAPVLILRHERTDRLPGGGANAAANLRSLDGAPRVIGRVGRDDAGESLLRLLADWQIDVTGVWRDPDYVTPVKRRTLAGSAHSLRQQVVRMDRGGGPPVKRGHDLLMKTSAAAATAVRGALISDYALGLFHADTIGPLLEALRPARTPVFVDSRSQLRLFRGATAATPNLQEAEACLGRPVGDDLQLLAMAGAALRDEIGARTLMVTRGSHGMSLFDEDRPPVHIPVYGTDEVADVTGAGDTVIAVFTLASLSGSTALEAALLANYAGGIVVMKRGTATVSRDELRRAVRDDAAFDARLEPRHCG